MAGTPQLGWAIWAEVLVAGDRLLLEEGDRVPADCRLAASHGLLVDLPVLTGESLPVAREATDPAAADQAPPIAPSERPNLLLTGSAIAAGRCEALVFATSAEREFGQVAHRTAGTRRGASRLETQVARIVHTGSTIAISTGLLGFVLSVVLVGMIPLESLVFAIGIIVATGRRACCPRSPWRWRSACSGWPGARPWGAGCRRWRRWDR